MSALERFSQSMVSSSYCESRLVSGVAVAGNVLGEVELILRYVDVGWSGVWSLLLQVMSVCRLEAGSYASGDAGK